MSNPSDERHKKLKELLNKSTPPADDFEKEALEGFSMLNNGQEALDLKQQLDDRIYPEVFAKKSTKAYWYAAAGLFLVIGFSVYVVLNNPSHRTRDMATVETPPKNEQLSAPPAAEAAVQSKPAEPAAEKEKGSVPSNVQQQERKKSSQPLVADEIAEEESQRTAEQLNNLPSKDAEVPAVAANNAAMRNQESADEKQDLLYEESKKSSATPAASGPPAVQSAPMAPAKAKTGTAKRREAQEPAAYSADAAAPAAIYAGGDAALQKELKEKLKAAGITSAFEAVLFIQNNKVEKAELNTAAELSNKQKKQVIEILKSLDKFSGQGSGTAKYALTFKP